MMNCRPKRDWMRSLGQTESLKLMNKSLNALAIAVWIPLRFETGGVDQLK
jgi:hypothetical protein